MKINKNVNKDRVSPEWDSLKIDYIKRFIELSKNSKLVFVFNEYFKDGSHMNSIGAEEFTKDLMGQMKKDKLIFLKLSL